MALTNDQITAQNFKEFYGQIRPYLNGAAHSGFTPVGVVISVMGKTAPLNYLVCDGTVYNIADYPELAAYFARQFDVCNYFGGNGTTTFAVPDLRGEFLRGAGTNSHTNQGSGSAVGEHQDATTVEREEIWPSGKFTKLVAGDLAAGRTTDSNIGNADSWIPSSTGKRNVYSPPISLSENNPAYMLGVRPTNTSVLYCIAYKNIFVDEGCNYSTDERVIGTWIDGKPIYQKTITGTIDRNKTILNITNMNIIGIPQFRAAYSRGYVFDSRTVNDLDFYTEDDTFLIITDNGGEFINREFIITVQYTKTTD